MAGVSVQAYVMVDGELRAAGDSVQSDASGRYELTVEFSGDSVTDVVLEASNSTGFEGKALLSGTIADGSSHTAPPMDNETHVEADVYVSARLDASWSSEGTSSAGLRALVNAELAATLSASATYASDVDACADAILAPLPRSGRQQPRVLTWARQRSL